MLSHLLALAGIDSVVVDNRTRTEIENTVRDRILERDSMRLLVDSGVSDRVLPRRRRARGDRAGFSAAGPTGSISRTSPARRSGCTRRRRCHRPGRRPCCRGRGRAVRGPRCVGLRADGSRSICRHEIPEAERRQYFREYPFAWFGIICDAPKSAPELICNHSERGFALISQRTRTTGWPDR